MLLCECFHREEGKKLNINRTYSVQGRILKDTELEEWVKYGQKKRRQIINTASAKTGSGRSNI